MQRLRALPVSRGPKTGSVSGLPGQGVNTLSGFASFYRRGRAAGRQKDRGDFTRPY